MRKGFESDGEKREVPKKQESGKKVEQVENVFKITTVIVKPFHGVVCWWIFWDKRKWFDKFVFIDRICSRSGPREIFANTYRKNIKLLVYTFNNKLFIYFLSFLVCSYVLFLLTTKCLIPNLFMMITFIKRKFVYIYSFIQIFFYGDYIYN